MIFSQETCMKIFIFIGTVEAVLVIVYLLVAPERLRIFPSISDIEISLSYQRTNNRLLCIVTTHPDSHKKKAVHVKATWGRRCQKLIFISSLNDTDLGAIAVPSREGYDQLWAKTKYALQYVYDKYFENYDWFLKADDDTYIIVENLLYFLSKFNPTEPLQFGARFINHLDDDQFMSGGAGYVLSKEALHRFVTKGLPNKELCDQGDTGNEDVLTAKCLSKIGVTPIDTRDEFGKSRFHPLRPTTHVSETHKPDPHDKWIKTKSIYPLKYGLDCCAETSISFHYCLPEDMYLLEFMIYKIKVK